jgi:hypothetical protein
MHMQPGRLQSRNQGMHVGAQQLHQHHADDSHWHGDRADYSHAEFFFCDQRQHGQRPYEAEQHFVDAGEGRVPGFVPAMRDGARICGQADPRRQRREFHVGLCPGDAESKIKSARASVKNQRGIQQVRFVQQASTFHHIQKSHE